MASRGIASNKSSKNKKVHWKWTDQSVDEYGNIEISHANPPSPPSPPPTTNRSTKLNLIFNYPYSASSKLPLPPPSPVLQPLRGDADIEPLDLYDISSAPTAPSLKPALRTPYATPQILRNLSGVSTPREWSHELELARIEVSKPSRIKNVSAPAGFPTSKSLLTDKLIFVQIN
jgi:hypothetical protein